MKKKILKFINVVTFITVLVMGSGVNAQEVTQTADLNVTGIGITETTDSSITLVWDEIDIAESYRVEYGTEPVVEQGDQYNLPPQEVESNQITVASLEPDTTYYFSVVAFGEDKATASQEYSAEVSATTLASVEFDIDEIMATDAETIEITFTEMVVTPENPSQEISIRLLDSPTALLNVTDVTTDTDDNAKLIVKTDTQSANDLYSIEISDAFVNTNGDMIPETSRTDSFTGYSLTNDDSASGAMTGLKLDSVNAVMVNDLYLVELDFNQDLDLDGSTTENFKIVRTNNPNQFLNINELKVNNQDSSKYLLVTDQQSEVRYSLIMTGLESLEGQTMSDDNSIVEFMGTSTATETPNETEEYVLNNLRAANAEEGKVIVSWDVPGADENIDGVNIYFSSDNGQNFEVLAENVNPTLGEYEIEELKVNTSYQIKVTTTSGEDETEGQIIDFEIAETGPASIAFGILTLSALTAWMIRRKNLYLPAGHFLK